MCSPKCNISRLMHRLIPKGTSSIILLKWKERGDRGRGREGEEENEKRKLKRGKRKEEVEKRKTKRERGKEEDEKRKK